MTKRLRGRVRQPTLRARVEALEARMDRIDARDRRHAKGQTAIAELVTKTYNLGLEMLTQTEDSNRAMRADVTAIREALEAAGLMKAKPQEART